MKTRPTAPGKALQAYRSKRNFAKTSEPRGKGRRAGPELAYVIQKHDASHLHFDLRLEVDGVMKSWAVPRGPSIRTAVKRLAVQVEDHPIEYNSFEGIIPKGEYGGGTVMIWDRGWWRFGGDDPDSLHGIREGLRLGKLEVVLEGRRLKGAWVLVRTGKQGSKPQWLLIKQRDRHAGDGPEPVERFTRSVVTRRTMAGIAAHAEQSGRRGS
ncbi:MAG TPA: DNA polymerase ligase N-terminal domain-containing protein [Gemmatimonadales bacterium]|nr:DNA polymerase ligase N-terminal domain-containing protein [Gemmatimonadales bacterium]